MYVDLGCKGCVLIDLQAVTSKIGCLSVVDSLQPIQPKQEKEEF